MHRARAPLILATLATLVAALPAVEAEWTRTVCTSTVEVWKNGRHFGPFPEIEGARYALPGVSDCDGWSESSETTCSGGGESESHSSSEVRPTRDGNGCEIFVEVSRTVIKEIDLEHDPRVHR